MKKIKVGSCKLQIFISVNFKNDLKRVRETSLDFQYDPNKNDGVVRWLRLYLLRKFTSKRYKIDEKLQLMTEFSD